MNLKLAGILIAIVVGMIGISMLNGGNDSSNSGGPSNASEDGTSNHVQGTSALGLRLVEAGDFECPACKSYYGIIKDIKEEYKDRIEFQFQNFPLSATHRNALAAHRAAEAAGNQDKFFEMHDILYEQQEDWNGPSRADIQGVSIERAIEYFRQYAEQLELDMVKYEEDFASPVTNKVISNDLKYLQDKGAISTPTFYLNGELVSNRELGSVEQARAFLDAKLAEAQAKVDAEVEGTTTEPTTDSSTETDAEKPAESSTTNEGSTEATQ